jgi:hypothetical protein
LGDFLQTHLVTLADPGKSCPFNLANNSLGLSATYEN